LGGRWIGRGEEEDGKRRLEEEERRGWKGEEEQKGRVDEKKMNILIEYK
jgi:hypothetical protein